MGNNSLSYLLNLVIIIFLFSFLLWSSIKVCMIIKKLSKINYSNIFISKKAYFIKYNLYYINNLLLILCVTLGAISYKNSENMVLYYIYVICNMLFVIYILIDAVFTNIRVQNLAFIFVENKIVFINFIVGVDEIVGLRNDKNHRILFILKNNGESITIRYNPLMITVLEDEYKIKSELII